MPKQCAKFNASHCDASLYRATTGINGRPFRLGCLDKNNSEIRVKIDELPPRIVDRGAHSTLIEGGMVMHLQLEQARSAGIYSGILTVVVNHF